MHAPNHFFKKNDEGTFYLPRVFAFSNNPSSFSDAAAATTRAMMLVGTANAIQESRTVNGGHGLSTGHANGVAATTQKITAVEQTGAGRINVMA